MAKPQQPELRRSGKVAALDPDASESDLSAHERPGNKGKVGDIPEDQRPGHRPEDEQDKPDLDAFAERLGVATEGDEPKDAPNVTDDERVGQRRWQPQWKRLVVPAVIGIGLVVILRRRRS